MSLAIGDLNHDGNPDLVAGGSNNTVSVLLGRPDGTFDPMRWYQTPACVASVAIGYLDDDANLDVVATNSCAVFPSVSVFLGNGDGTLNPTSRKDYGTGWQPTSVTIGDLDGDGHPDLVVTAGDSVFALRGDGHGAFGPRANFFTGKGPDFAAIGDLNHDGIPDMVVANNGSRTVSVLVGTGGGTFSITPDTTLANPRCVAIRDLNGDGNPDLAVACSESSMVCVLLGNGDGTFKPRKTYQTWCCPASVAIGDLNRDGIPDLVVADASQPTYLVSVLLGNGDGTFKLPRSDFPAAPSPVAVAIGDFNHDDRPDLAVADNNFSSVSVLLNTTASTAVPPVALPGRFALMLAGPNPAHNAMNLAATLPYAAKVDVAIYSLQGSLVRRLLAGASLPAGIHPLVWDARDESGARAPSGVYFARMRADGVVSGRTTIVLR